MKTLHMTLDGMHCEKCVQTVENAIAAVPGVQFCEVEVNRARVDFDESTCRSGAVIAAIRSSGQFEVVHFELSGAGSNDTVGP